MEPLDLTEKPPRSPWVQLDGLYLLPRTIDKLRASLAGGNAGEYKIPGFSSRMLDAFGVSEDDLRDAVAEAESDDDVARWFRDRVDVSKYPAFNAAVSNRRIADIDDKEDFFSRYPLARELPLDSPLFDLLDRDDAAV